MLKGNYVLKCLRKIKKDPKFQNNIFEPFKCRYFR